MSEALVRASDFAQMNLEDLAKQDPRALALALVQSRKQDVATLGDNEVFVRRDDQGMVRAVRAVVQLSEARGEIYSIPTGHYDQKGNWVNDAPKTMITAPGYQKLNQVPGLSIVTPPTITLPDGNKVVNPYLVRERDAKTGRSWTVGVWVRKVCVGHSPIGNLCVVDSSLYLDLGLYFMQDLLKKIKNNAENGNIFLETEVTDEMRKTHLILPYQYGIVIAADLRKKQIRAVLDTHIQRQKFGERVATGIVERNALRKHPAIAATQVLMSKDGIAGVQVFGWRHDLSKQEIDEAINGMEQGENIPGVQLISHTATVGDDDEDAIDAQASVDEDRDKEKEIQRDSAEEDAEGGGEEEEEEGEEEKGMLFGNRPDAKISDGIEILKETYGKPAFDEEFRSATEQIPAPWQELSTAEKKNLLEQVGMNLYRQAKKNGVEKIEKTFNKAGIPTKGKGAKS